MDVWQDIGGGTEIAWLENREGDIVGLIEQHDCNGHHSGGAVLTNPNERVGEPHWTVKAGINGNIEGLTLSPSIACRSCSHHGWIRDGHWVDA